MAFPAVTVSCITAVRTFIMHLKIVVRIAVSRQQYLPFFPKPGDGLPELFNRLPVAI